MHPLVTSHGWPTHGDDFDRSDADSLLPSAARSPTLERAARLRRYAAPLLALLCGLVVALIAWARVGQQRSLAWRDATLLMLTDSTVERDFQALGSWYLPSGRRLDIVRNALGASGDPEYKLSFGGLSFPVLGHGASWFQTQRRFCGGFALFTNESIQCADGNVFQSHRLDTMCHTWPAAWTGQDFEENCLEGNYIGDGFRYLVNAKRGTPEAACGQDAQCWCCRYPASNLRLPVPLLNPSQAELFNYSLAVAMDAAHSKLVAAGKTQLLFAMFSKELIDITRNFLCAVSSWISGSSTGLIIVSVDLPCSVIEATAGLSSDIMCVQAELKVKPPSKHDDVVYQSSRYLFMVSLKLILWNIALKVATFRGGTSWFLLSDVDIVIKEDPFEFLQSHQKFVAEARSRSMRGGSNGKLMFCMRDSFMEGEMAHVRNTGFCFLEPTATSVELLDEAMVNLKKGLTTEWLGYKDLTDQGAINVLVMNKQATVVILPWRRYSNGLLYFGLNMSSHATVIHANMIKNSAMKTHCFKLSGNWYTDADSCRPTLPAVRFVTSNPNSGSKMTLIHGVNVSLDKFKPVTCTALD